MRAWQVMAVIGMCAAVLAMGCAKKEGSLEQAGKKMDAALNEMDREVSKTINQK